MCTWSMERQSKRPGSLEVEKLKPPADFVTDSTQGVKGVDMEPWRRRLARLWSGKLQFAIIESTETYLGVT